MFIIVRGRGIVKGFVRVRQIGVYRINAVIASQCAHWRGNPPVRGKIYRKAPGKVGVTAIFGGNRYLVPFNRGIATPVCGLVRNDRKLGTSPTNTNLQDRSDDGETPPRVFGEGWGLLEVFDRGFKHTDVVGSGDVAVEMIADAFAVAHLAKDPAVGGGDALDGADRPIGIEGGIHGGVA